MTVTLGACVWLTGVLPPLFLVDGVIAATPYDLQLSSWLQGRWDVPSSLAERFEIGGRSYIYFAPTPVLLRLPFAEWVVLHPGKIGFLAHLLAVAGALGSALLLTYAVAGESPGTVLVLALIGPLLIIASRPSVYNEAIAWGAGFIMLAAAFVFRYWRAPSLALLGAAAACGLLSAQAREIWLPAALALMALPGFAALVQWRWPLQSRVAEALDLPRAPRPAAHAAAAAAAILLMIGTPLVIHRIKFGEWGLVPPIEKHASLDRATLEKIGGAMFHIANLRTGLYNYLSPGSIRYRSEFPWVHPIEQPRLFPETRLAGFELFIGLPHAAGALMVLTTIGLLAAPRVRALRWPLLVFLGLALGSGTLIFFVYLCGRYLFDFLPPLAVGGAMGARALRHHPRGRVLMATVAIMAIYNVIAGSALAFLHQQHLAPPPRVEQVKRFARHVDERLSTGEGRAVKAPRHLRKGRRPRPVPHTSDSP